MTDTETNAAEIKTPGVTSATPAGASVLAAPNSDWKTVPRRPSNSNSRLEDVTEEGEEAHDRRGPKGAGGPPPVVRKWGPVPSLGAGGPPRSQSFSVGQHQDSFVENQMKAAVKSAVSEDLDPAVLASMDEELTEEEYAQMIMDKLRSSRSKSTTLGSSPLGSSPRRGSTEGVWRAARMPLSARSTGPPPGLGGTPRAGAGLGVPDDLRNQRRFSLAPSAFGASPSNAMAAAAAGGGTTMRLFGGALAHRGSTAGLPPEAYLALRRHSLAGPAPAPHTASSSAAYRHLSDALDHLQLDEFRKAQYGGLAEETVDEYFDPEARRKSLADVGKGIPLSQIPTTTPLYIVEFKAGRSDLFYAGDSMAAMVKKGDLVIVEADRGKDLGKVVNDNITPAQVQQLQQQQAEQMPELLRSNKELHPKRIYRLAQPGEVAMLLTKSQDEIKALQVCQTKVRQKKLPMEVVDAEYQWDRRKLTFYFVADRRIDFRELVRDLFKIYKTRIWMCAVNPAAATGAVPGVTGDTKEE